MTKTTKSSKGYERPTRGTYIIQVPMIFKRKDVVSEDWLDVRTDMLANIYDMYDQVLSNVENDIATKH